MEIIWSINSLELLKEIPKNERYIAWHIAITEVKRRHPSTRAIVIALLFVAILLVMIPMAFLVTYIDKNVLPLSPAVSGGLCGGLGSIIGFHLSPLISANIYMRKHGQLVENLISSQTSKKQNLTS